LTANRLAGSDTELTHRRVLLVATPIILSNATVPLVGIADTAVMGQLDDPALLGAVAIASTIFTMLFWAFAFLRMGTTGLTAQAAGADDWSETQSHLYRGLLIAGAAGLLIIVLSAPIARLSFHLIESSDAVERAALDYFWVRILSAPAALASYALVGWFIGLARADVAFVLQVFLNLLNVGLNVLFVIALGYGIEGVALATVIAEYAALLLGLAIALRIVRRRAAPARLDAIFAWPALRRVFSVNADIMIRTLCLVFVFTFFTAESARFGDVTLAANSVLRHFLLLSAYLLDGFANAAEVLAGHSIGARRRAAFRQAVVLSSVWAGCLAAGISALFILFGGTLIDLMTLTPEVRSVARELMLWAAISPLIGVGCFQLDGIFIGATRGADIRNMMILSLAAFLAAWWMLTPAYGNHGLWAALMVFFVMRAVTLGFRYPALERDAFSPVWPRQPSAPPRVP
jgi:MATE family multidrug resistance protein